MIRSLGQFLEDDAGAVAVDAVLLMIPGVAVFVVGWFWAAIGIGSTGRVENT